MKITTNITSSSYGREVTVRMNRHVAQALCEHMRQDDNNEQMAFGLASNSATAEGTVLHITELLLPGKSDLTVQSPVSVCPTREFQSVVYFRAFQTRKAIVEFHTHPGSSAPHFSGIDDTHSERNARYISQKLPKPVTLALLVGNNRFSAFDGMIYDRHLQAYRPIDRLEILGRPSEIHLLGETAEDHDNGTKDEFSRQLLIPGWNQRGIEQTRIAVFGLGGDGAHVIQTLLSIGAGRHGFLILADPDVIEASNLPRIPYALPEHIGVPKVTVAAQLAGRKSPGTPIYPFPCSASEKAVRDRMKMATLIIGCGDNDGLRKEANELAIRYGIPYIDTGCDIQTNEQTVEAGGQVRVVLPGENACLACCRGFDPSQAALDQLDNTGRAIRAVRGYVRNASTLATPSVANLNAFTAQFAIAQFLALIHGEQFGNWDYLHFDQLTGRTIPAKSKRREECLVCGLEGCFGAGDVFPEEGVPQKGKAPRTNLLLKAWEKVSKK